MKEQLHLRIKNPEIKEKIDDVCKSKGMSFNQFFNDVLEEYFAQNEDKTYLKKIYEILDWERNIFKENSEIERKNTLILGRCLTLSLLENSKNIIEMKERNIDPNEYYGAILPDSIKLLNGEHKFYEALFEFVKNYHEKK